MACTAGPAAAVPSGHPFEIEPGSFHIATSTDQAAAHEDLTTSFDFAHNVNGQTYNDVRSVIVNLPPGFIGNNTAIPICTQAQLLSFRCPVASQVGTITLHLNLSQIPSSEYIFPVYNMEVTSFGTTAMLGFDIGGLLIQELPINVRPGDSGVTITTPDIEKNGEVHHISVTIWGVPAAHEHDAERGRICEEITTVGDLECEGGSKTANIPIKPFLSNPTSCGPTIVTMEAYSWEEPEHVSRASAEIAPIAECERVPFEPSLVAQPTTNAAESPAGLNISLVVPQRWEEPFSIGTANIKDTVLALPVGYTVNPSAGSGLGVCTPAQYAAETSSSLPGEGCPAESKIGAVEVETPVLAEKLTGAIYVAKPFDNPFDSLLGLYIVVKDPARGIVVKLAGHIEPDPVTGQLVTRVDEDPQVPFSKFTLKLRQGATSPLVSPPACGTYTAEADFTPWSAPELPRHLVNSFQIEKGIGGGPCPAGGVPPFHPGIVAGTLNNSAGSYSPMDIRITRNDGEQEITRFTSILPPGLTAKLAGVPFCPDTDIEAAKHVSGAQEETEPSCPAASEIGHSLVGAGVGSVLAYTPGKVYMAGPYNGAPFSIVAITSAKVGPFDLGTVVVREALVINPETAVVTVDAKASDPIPHIIDGIVIHVRDIRVYIDRPQFMINPTNCDPASFAATVDGAGADFTNPADQVPVTVTNSFQMANCQNLQFKPGFKVSTSGRPSRLDGESLHVRLSYPNAPQGTQTNIKLVKVELPKQLPSRLPTLQKACPEKTFVANPALCPAASVIGHATASTPILPVPLTGPAYFVSYGGAKFPELIIVLQGYGVTLDLHGETFISKAGITSSTFKTVPDDPIGTFELTLPQGPFSALAANGNPCKGTLTMPTEFLAQNGDAIHENTKIAVSGCPKHKAKAKRRAKKAGLRAKHPHGKGVRARRK
ncbi:MAG TPA: hypothetical protein VNY52_05060 [Solirubrobacteraceae bacterium]|nr:hypothetical protein [Solirubrobacteraceae bacterium]